MRSKLVILAASMPAPLTRFPLGRPRLRMPGMKKDKRPETEALIRRIANPEVRDIDELYGLEPVYEPGESGIPALQPDEFVAIQCPWCGERLETHVDLTAGERSYIEDCQVCCRPMELSIELEENGALHAVKVQRID